MNQTFSINRFGRLLRKYFTDNRGQLLTGLALMTGILMVGALLFYKGLPFQADWNRGISLFFSAGHSGMYLHGNRWRC